jgi:hypothetical protein
VHRGPSRPLFAAPPELERSPEQELEELYLRYKSLALAVGAGLLLERVDPALVEESQELIDASLERAQGTGGGHLAPQFEALLAGARDLHRLAVGFRSGLDGISISQLEGARASHREVRRGVWEIVPCEYVPCNGAHVAGAAAGGDRA